MIKGRRYFLFLVILISCSMISANVVFAGDIEEPYPLDFLSFVKYHVIESDLNGDILSRTIKLEVTNTSPYVLSNVIASLDGLPENITSNDPEAILGNIGSGTTIISNDTFYIAVDLSQQSTSEIKLIWRVEYEINGEQTMDETSVIETIQ